MNLRGQTSLSLLVRSLCTRKATQWIETQEYCTISTSRSCTALRVYTYHIACLSMESLALHLQVEAHLALFCHLKSLAFCCRFFHISAQHPTQVSCSRDYLCLHLNLLLLRYFFHPWSALPRRDTRILLFLDLIFWKPCSSSHHLILVMSEDNLNPNHGLNSKPLPALQLQFGGQYIGMSSFS